MQVICLRCLGLLVALPGGTVWSFALHGYSCHLGRNTTNSAPLSTPQGRPRLAWLLQRQLSNQSSWCLLVHSHGCGVISSPNLPSTTAHFLPWLGLCFIFLSHRSPSICFSFLRNLSNLVSVTLWESERGGWVEQVCVLSPSSWFNSPVSFKILF